MEIAHRLAEALDADDYAAIVDLLEPDASYSDGQRSWSGADAIVESFLKSSQWGRANLDELLFSHEIDDAVSPLQIRLIDELRLRGERLVIDHTMHVHLSPRGLVEQLRLEYPPGERERVSAFFKRLGI